MFNAECVQCKSNEENMRESTKSVWFEGTNRINCTIYDLETSLRFLEEHFKGVVSIMPGMTSVELIERGDHFVTTKTDEGIMKRQ